MAANASDSISPRSATILVSALGTSTPTIGCPGTGASIRIDGAARASARSSARRVIRLTRTLVLETSSARMTC